MKITTISLPTILIMLPFACMAGEQRSLTRFIDPIEVSGSEAPDITGTEISNLRVMTSSNGILIPIPFQIDQKNSRNDWVWSSVYEFDNVDDWFIDETMSQPIDFVGVRNLVSRNESRVGCDQVMLRARKWHTMVIDRYTQTL